jgi:tRNA (guanine37-N1)-methyltransferase
MRFDVLTLFPAAFDGYLSQSLLAKAIDKGLLEVHRHNIRDWASDRHHRVDDRPYGGGPGMVMMAPPVVECVEAVQQMSSPAGLVVLLTPQGEPFRQQRAEQLAASARLLLLCGRYEGFDQRIVDLLHPLELSIGDYVLNGGEVAAMVVIDAVARLLPGVLGDQQSSQQDSFSDQRGFLEHAQYTRPPEYRGLAVPEVLLSGDHPRIARWRAEQSYLKTQQRRADLLKSQEPGHSPPGQ